MLTKSQMYFPLANKKVKIVNIVSQESFINNTAIAFPGHTWER